MKRIDNTIKYFSLVCCTALFALLAACTDDGDKGKYQITGGEPTIHYVRYAGTAQADLLLDGAYMGDNIVLIGDNLTSIRELFFNDQQALLNINLITANTLFVNVPRNVPANVTNKIWMVTGGGDTVGYDFKVLIPAPVVTGIKCEMVPQGEDVVLYGDYLFNSNLRITIGSSYVVPDGDIVSADKTSLTFKAPAADVTGPVTVATAFGEAAPTAGWLNDRRGWITGFEADENGGTGFVPGWKRPDAKDLEEDPAYASYGKYVKLAGPLTAGAWSSYKIINIWSSTNTDNPNSGIPDPMFPSDPATSILKFEVNVPQAWSGLPMIICFKSANDNEGYLWNDATAPRAFWVPWLSTGSYTTEGWVTVSIPLSDMKYNGAGAEVAPSTEFGGLGMAIHNRGGNDYIGTDCNPVILIDNIRVVPGN